MSTSRFDLSHVNPWVRKGEEMPLVKIYFGVGDDVASDVPNLDRRMGTLDALNAANLSPLLETERVIDDRHLDGNGFWTPTHIVDDE